MFTAIPIWQGRVSPVLDVARQFLLVDLDEGKEGEARAIHIESLSRPSKVHQLVDLGIDKIVCGAVSNGLETLLTSSGIEIVAGVCGEVDAVLEALISGTLDAPEFEMPGGCCRGKRGRGASSSCGHFRRNRRGKSD